MSRARSRLLQPRPPTPPQHGVPPQLPPLPPSPLLPSYPNPLQPSSPLSKPPPCRRLRLFAILPSPPAALAIPHTPLRNALDPLNSEHRSQVLPVPPPRQLRQSQLLSPLSRSASRSSPSSPNLPTRHATTTKSVACAVSASFLANPQLVQSRNTRPKMSCVNYPTCKALWCDRCVNLQYVSSSTPPTFPANPSS